MGTRRLLIFLVLGTIAWLPGREATPSRVLAESENILTYLARHHPDFRRMSIVPHSQLEDGQWRCFLTIDESTVLETLVLPVDNMQRSLFDALSGTMLRPRNPTVNPATLSWLGVAWYWDFRVSKTPALIDHIADTMRGSEGHSITMEEARAFWYYRYQLSFHRNRMALHQSWIHHPELLQRLSPGQPWSEEEILGIFTVIDYRFSPILNPSESLSLLKSLQTIPSPFQNDRQESSIDSYAMPGSIKTTQRMLLQNRLTFIRRNILYLNPLAVNALRSLGVACEHALSGNHQGVQEAWALYLEDLKLVEEVVRFLSQQPGKPN